MGGASGVVSGCCCRVGLYKSLLWCWNEAGGASEVGLRRNAYEVRSQCWCEASFITGSELGARVGKIGCMVGLFQLFLGLS